MTQASVLKLLQKNKENWITTKGIAVKLGITNSSTIMNLNKLYIQGLIHRRIRKNIMGAGTYEWRVK